MIYIARSLFLFGTLFLCLGLCFIAAQLLLQQHLPEAYKGYWIEAFFVVCSSTIMVSLAQLLGNDLTGPRVMINQTAEDGYKAYRRSDILTKTILMRAIISTILFLFMGKQ